MKNFIGVVRICWRFAYLWATGKRYYIILLEPGENPRLLDGIRDMSAPLIGAGVNMALTDLVERGISSARYTELEEAEMRLQREKHLEEARRESRE